MSEQLRESISALMDGEADELELRRLLSADAGESVKRTWASYHVARDVMQGNEVDAYRHLDISRQVSMAINDSPHGVDEGDVDQLATVAPGENYATAMNASQTGAPERQAAGSWWRPMAGFAVAASVAMAVVVGVQTLDNGGESGFSAGMPVAVHSAATSSRVYPVAGASMQASGGAGGAVRYQSTELPGDIAASRAAADMEARQRLERFMLRHTEHAALNNGQGMTSFARVASFEEH